jgi:DNA (cytosine-5)-methyltransferase 1
LFDRKDAPVGFDRKVPSFYEFFAGGGMARAGLGEGWNCLFANDFDEKKGSTYAANWGSDALLIRDVAAIRTEDLPGQADLAWASFPCQDLSLAGDYRGLAGKRSGTFWRFWDLMENLNLEGRSPRVVVLENVCGAITSHEGKDFAAIGVALARTGYRFGALVMDAVDFLPQSRPRLFLVGVREPLAIAPSLIADEPQAHWHPDNLIAAQSKMPALAKSAWVWWNLPTPPPRRTLFSDFIEENPEGVKWHSKVETEGLVSMMSAVNRKKLEQAKRMGTRVVGGLYRRTRRDEDGVRVQRAEVRFDGVAGCLRTPGGGSSRQTILVVEGKLVRSRLLSAREAARLMGLPDSYQLPVNYNDGYHLAGDGVAVPVVRYLTEHLLASLAKPALKRRKAAA